MTWEPINTISVGQGVNPQPFLGNIAVLEDFFTSMDNQIEQTLPSDFH